jgi:iron complex transport system permease protein
VTRRAALAGLSLLWVATLVGAPLVGSQPIDLGAALSGDPQGATILFRLRLPRVLLALLAGGILAVCGLAFQTLFRNPLAEPYTLGVAGGAALGAVVAIHLGSEGSLAGVGAASFAGAVAAAALVAGLATRRRGLPTGTLLLAGIAVSASSSSLILFLQYVSDSTKTFRMVRWMMGGLTVVDYGEVLWVAPWALGLAVLLLALRWDLNLLLTGEETAAARGVDLARLRWLVLGGSSLALGALVAVAGPIGFVGLIVPHLLRRLFGHDHLWLTPASILGGGVFLALCDLAARTAMAPAELPVGVLTALLGGPFFLWLLLAGRR